MGDNYKVERGYKKVSVWLPKEYELQEAEKALRKSRQRMTFLNEYFSETGLQKEEPEDEELCHCVDGSNVVEKS